ncbi:unnamed protein product [Discosporangium mesarthrocarpum]
MGEIAASAGERHTKPSPLSMEIMMFVRLTAVIATITASAFFVAGMAIRPNFMTNFVFFVGEKKGGG